MGQRTAKTDSTGQYALVSDGASPAAPVLADGGTVYTPGLSSRKGGSSEFRHGDLLGSLRFLTDANQTVVGDRLFSAFGATVAWDGDPSTPFGWVGDGQSQTDADTGLVLMGHRVYDSRLGRFLSQDPAGDGDNWYAYCGNDPVNGTDPTGLKMKPIGDGYWQDEDSGVIAFGLDGADLSDTSTSDDGPNHVTINTGTTIIHGGGGSSSGPSDANDFGVGGVVDSWVTFGTITHAGNVAGAYDSSRASRGAMLGAGALAAAAIVAAGASRGTDAAEGDAAKFLTKELLATARRINPCKQSGNLAVRYGGKAINWVKKSTIIIEHPETAEDVEIHWFENMKDNIGRVDIKWKFNPWE